MGGTPQRATAEALPPAGCGIRIFRHVWNPRGGVKKIPKTSTQPHTLFFGGFRDFRPKKEKKIGPKWCPKMVKIAPKLTQNRRNNWRGSPRKSQRIPKISEKWPKTLPLKCENAPKKVKMAKNRQKMAKIIRKIDFLYNNFPKKAISLRKCTPKKNSPSAKKKVQIFFRAFGAIQ